MTPDLVSPLDEEERVVLKHTVEAGIQRYQLASASSKKFWPAFLLGLQSKASLLSTMLGQFCCIPDGWADRLAAGESLESKKDLLDAYIYGSVYADDSPQTNVQLPLRRTFFRSSQEPDGLLSIEALERFLDPLWHSMAQEQTHALSMPWCHDGKALISASSLLISTDWEIPSSMHRGPDRSKTHSGGRYRAYGSRSLLGRWSTHREALIENGHFAGHAQYLVYRGFRQDSQAFDCLVCLWLSSSPR
jgi:hypothetical protein